MDIKEIPEVIVDIDDYSKFIVAQITNGKDSRLIVRINENCNHHINILALLKKEIGPDLNVSCIGGGYVNIDPQTDTMKIYGISSEFGIEPDRQQTVIMLQKKFKKFHIISSVGLNEP